MRLRKLLVGWVSKRSVGGAKRARSDPSWGAAFWGGVWVTPVKFGSVDLKGLGGLSRR